MATIEEVLTTDPFANEDATTGVLPEKRMNAKQRTLQAAQNAEVSPTFAGAGIQKLSTFLPEPTIYSAKDLEGEEVLIHNVKFSTGEFGDFAIMQIERADGEQALFTCGGVTIMNKLQTFSRMVAANRAQFPVSVKVVSKDLGKRGYAPMWDFE